MTHRTLIPITEGTKSNNRSLDNVVPFRGKSPARTQLSRKSLNNMHQDPNKMTLENSTIAKGMKFGSGMVNNSIQSGLQIASSGMKGLFGQFNTANPQKKGIIYAALAGVFGLFSLRGILDIPKKLLNHDPNKPSAPMLFTVGKLFTGGTLAYGAIKALTSGASFSSPSIYFGGGLFLLLHLLTSAYENEHSSFGRILELLGLKDKFKEIADGARGDSILGS